MEIHTKIIGKALMKNYLVIFLRFLSYTLCRFYFLFYWRRLINARDKNICQQLTKRALIYFKCIYYKKCLDNKSLKSLLCYSNWTVEMFQYFVEILTNTLVINI